MMHNLNLSSEQFRPILRRFGAFADRTHLHRDQTRRGGIQSCHGSTYFTHQAVFVREKVFDRFFNCSLTGRFQDG